MTVAIRPVSSYYKKLLQVYNESLFGNAVISTSTLIKQRNTASPITVRVTYTTQVADVAAYIVELHKF